MLKDETIQNKYFKNLDALRLATFLVIFLNHSFFTNNIQIEQDRLVQQLHNFFSFAYIGLDFFSVLSSFLITWLIFTEYKVTNRFKIKSFYMRRILRIWPLYYLIVFIGYMVVPILTQLLNIPTPQLPPIGWFLFLGLNYYMGYIDDNFLFSLAFLWFITVEEQFYLFWAIALKYFKKYFQLICLLLVLTPIFINYFSPSPYFPSFYDTLNYLPNFAFGAYLAYLCIEKNNLYRTLSRASKKFWALFYISFLLILVFNDEIFHTVSLNHLKHIVLSIFFSIFLFGQTFSTTSLFNAGKYKHINYLGQISFGLYCWHGIVITVIKKLSAGMHYQETYFDILVVFPILSFLLTVLISILSYEFFEVKFLKLKEYFSPIKKAKLSS